MEMVTQIYPTELQLNKTNSTDTKAAFLDLHLIIVTGFVSSKSYDKRDDFEFGIANFPFLDCEVPRTPLSVFTFLSLFGLQRCLVIYQTLMLITKL